MGERRHGGNLADARAQPNNLTPPQNFAEGSAQGQCPVVLYEREGSRGQQDCGRAEKKGGQLILWCPVATGQRPQATRPEFLLRGHGRDGGGWACDKDGLGRHARSEGGQPAASATTMWPQNRPGYENFCRAPPEGSARLCGRKDRKQTATGSRVGGNRTTESREVGRKEARERESEKIAAGRI